jgi:hypothetical protein
MYETFKWVLERQVARKTVNQWHLFNKHGRVVMAWLGGSLEAVDSPARAGSRAAHQAGVCRARMLVQPPAEVPVHMAGDCQWQKHTNEGAPSRRQLHAECTTLRREQLDNGTMGLILPGNKAGQYPKWKEKKWSQQLSTTTCKGGHRCNRNPERKNVNVKLSLCFTA